MTGLVFASYKRSGWVTRHQRGPKTEAPTSTNNETKEFRKEFLKKFGEDAIVDFDQTTAQVPVFSTGALTLDLALGGGLPYGKLVEVYGPEQSGKTTLALSCCVSLQKSGRRKNCAFIDVEHALNTDCLAVCFFLTFSYYAILGMIVDDYSYYDQTDNLQFWGLGWRLANTGLREADGSGFRSVYGDSTQICTGGLKPGKSICLIPSV